MCACAETRGKKHKLRVRNDYTLTDVAFCETLRVCYSRGGQERRPKSKAGNHCWITGSPRNGKSLLCPPPLMPSLVCQPTNCSLKRRALAGDEVEQLISRLSSLPQKHVGLSPVSGGTATLPADCKTHKTHTRARAQIKCKLNT